ncbi:acyl-CoA dehydrogenase family protein [Acidovorax sp. CCYZU-2555]|uniref:acyl-CoA dehydrogenase family protein n=1 Tax=Acidovorax sp. CCYZU-2555 TaxID=2835042 RepID=UPI001BCDD9B2|nr:acyl-CoA dehydrogenase family protein [Acidovorax sp. CCYZU-2555]MBS7777181.1 acyl-CoA dehydrogenase family protein [Acidovorax sp. CCYZU-2555]
MDFNFSEDQQQLRDAVRRWVSKGYTFERRREIVAAGGFSRAAYTELAELGLTALAVPEAHDGLGQGPVDVMVAMEELGRGIVLEPLAQAVVASAVLSQYAPADVQAQWLPKIASGEALVVLAQQERKARYRLDVCSATAKASGNGHVVTAHKSLVPVGDQADAFLVPAQLGGQIALFLVERNASGVALRGYGTQDGGRAAELQCTDAPATLLTQHGLTALTLASDVANAALCAEAVGVMEQTLAITVDYMNQRKQFGVVIASFQALRHRVADMKMQLELARSMSYYASLKITAPAAERHLAIARARVQLGQAMRFVGQQAVQLHGGIGVTDEYIVSHYFKRLTQLEMTFGDSLHHLGEVSAGMQETAGVFA